MRIEAFVRAAVFAAAVAAAPGAHADLTNFEISARLYTKWLYRNNDRGGLLGYGNPFWPENLSGDNGVGSELELSVRGRVSDAVEAYARVQSRFGEVWQDWWENGNRLYTAPNTSGESLGLDHAAYFKLRGYHVRARLPIPTLKYAHIGSSDLSMFNAWTIGKVRYIDRDSAKGVFFAGEFGRGRIEYLFAAIALPKLWVGPSWSTGIGEERFFPNESKVVSPFWQQDWAYAARLAFPAPRGKVAVIGTITDDHEADIYDPDAVGTLAPTDPLCGADRPERTADPDVCPDHAVSLATRFRAVNATVEGKFEIGRLVLDATVAYSRSVLNPTYTANGVALNGGVFPMPYKDTGGGGIGGVLAASATVVRASAGDLAGGALTLKAEGFAIGPEFNAVFGARRESDVLLTDGLLGGYQLPTLNLANEFTDFDEPFAESVIGWAGGTVVGEIAHGDLTLVLEGTLIGYLTNALGRDVKFTYPDFLHADGYTDVDLYDYANPKSIDRGRDPRSVYREDQQRLTAIGVLTGTYTFGIGSGLDLSVKAKLVSDVDRRSDDIAESPLRDCRAGACDDYDGKIVTLRAALAYPVNDELKVALGFQIDRWVELNRSGTKAGGYQDYLTDKRKLVAGVNYLYAGLKFGYVLEFVAKDVRREIVGDPDWPSRPPSVAFRVVRSKGTLEVAW